MASLGALRQLKPELQQLLNFFSKGKRFAQREMDVPMIASDSPEARNLVTHFRPGYYEGSPSDISFEDIERLSRGVEQGFTLPAWRGVRSFLREGKIDPSFETRGAHVDLSPSAHASRRWLEKYGSIYDIPENMDPRTLDIDKARLMTQVAIKRPKNTLFATDREANTPEELAEILGIDPVKFFSDIDSDALTHDQFQRILPEYIDRDIDILYPNIGEVAGSSNASPFSRSRRAFRSGEYLNNPKITPFKNYLKDKDEFSWHPIHPTLDRLPLDIRFQIGEDLMSDPNFMKEIGNPSYIVTDPRRMRDIGAAQFTNPEGKTIFDAKGGRVKGGLSSLR
jgi:hypothetical protein